MELSKLIPGAMPLPVFLPNGEDTSIVLKVVGKESARFFAASNKWTSHMQAMPEGRNATLQELAEMQADLLASLIVDWKGLEQNGAPLPYSHEQAVKLMQTPELTFMRNAVEEFASDRANFFRPSAEGPGPKRKATRKAKQPQQ